MDVTNPASRTTSRFCVRLGPLLLGGLAYSAGAIADFIRRPVLIPGVLQSHELFHLSVLAGALLHWYFVWRSAGEVPRTRDGPDDARVSPEAVARVGR